ncbi:hypothetical protein F2Q68_00025281 [Brassica cretica]|uniref:Uncharacterized protein n=1 Tax=Brassica cretica TaxID=69181 RepID=A0A8S9I9I6_BRACR|nr:hypothetical protein F2Q68_00025281 [Brassica cretica]
MVSILRGVGNLRHMWYVDGTACIESSHGVPTIALYDADICELWEIRVFLTFLLLTEIGSANFGSHIRRYLSPDLGPQLSLVGPEKVSIDSNNGVSIDTPFSLSIDTPFSPSIDTTRELSIDVPSRERYERV